MVWHPTEAGRRLKWRWDGGLSAALVKTSLGTSQQGFNNRGQLPTSSSPSPIPGKKSGDLMGQIWGAEMKGHS
jgi:hypothetical protein